jgi:peptidase M28-like protein
MTREPGQLEAAIRHLASIPRPSASEGEREAAEWLAGELRAAGCREARVEEERAHGTYWWPLGLLSGLAAVGGLAALRGRRLTGLAAGAFAAAGIAGDIGGGSLWFRRRFLPHRSTWNVVAEAGDPDARETVVFVGHHDAAHSGLLFHPAIPRYIADHFPALIERSDTTAPVMFPVFAGPVAVALGSALGLRSLVRAGTFLAAGSVASFADIGARAVVPGANDNLTGAVTVLGIAQALAERPVEGIRVLLVSTGSEESFMEGMHGFARRHFPALPTAHTRFVCIDTVGSEQLIVLESEGMLVMRPYPEWFKSLLQECAEAEGIELRRGLKFRNATDGLISLRGGYDTLMIGSVNRDTKLPANYHWPTDTADNVMFETVDDAVRLCDAVTRRLAAGAAPAPG